MIDRNAVYFASNKELRLSLLCGVAATNNTYTRFPSHSILSDFTVKAQFKDDMPYGCQIADTMDLSFQCSAFTGDYADLAYWIDINSNEIPADFGVSPLSDSTSIKNLPNIWILSNDVTLEDSNLKIYYIGIQTESTDDTQWQIDSGKETYKISTLSIFKYAMENTLILDCDLPTDVSKLFNCRIVDGFIDIPEARLICHDFPDKEGTYSPIIIAKTWWGMLQNTYIAAAKLWSELTRNNLQGIVYGETVPPLYKDFTFFKQNYNLTPQSTDQNVYNINAPLNNITEVKLLAFILNSYHNNTIKKDIHPNGLLYYFQQKYKNLWNLYVDLSESFAQRVSFNYGKNSVLNQYTICKNYDYKLKLDKSNIPISSFKYSADSKKCNQVIATNISASNKDQETISSYTDTNNSKTQFNTTIEIGSTGNCVEKGYHWYFKAVNTRIGITFYASDGTDINTIPIHKFVYSCDNDFFKKIIFQYGNDYQNTFMKVSHYVDVLAGSTSYMFNYNPHLTIKKYLSECTTLDDINTYLYFEQSGQMNPNLTTIIQDIYAQMLMYSDYGIVEIKGISANLINNTDLGNEFYIDVNSFKTNNSFRARHTYKNRAVLVNCETNYTSMKSDCKFFIRNDKWA